MGGVKGGNMKVGLMFARENVNKDLWNNALDSNTRSGQNFPQTNVTVWFVAARGPLNLFQARGGSQNHSTNTSMKICMFVDILSLMMRLISLVDLHSNHLLVQQYNRIR